MSLAPFDVSDEHPAFAGHFPGTPILPGVVLLDEALYRIANDRLLDLKDWQLASTKFTAIVRPGDALLIEHEALANGSVRFTIRRGGGANPQVAVASGLLVPAARLRKIA